ncbi:DUF3014 domain-containing protein [Pyxidicoccus sp. MSG2]|uniref:DUF3014 domain-containing protein n=1 Tax=Pyxidicoccus sp. MSG2 TaxID=2996790 RepID=UPI002270B7B7|nr:DUF3014 domain-containing protein [Pyxidicoccus sp. MSG2]MCY1020592.1 DUF3014 domain-containing protein [Pyxidicoccus sp. MSG2]
MNTPENAPTPSSVPSTRSSRGPLVATALVVVLLVGGVAAYLLRAPEPAPAPAPVPEQAAPVAAVPAPPAVQLSGTDPRVRELLRGLSSDADFLRWLSAEDLVRRFTAATNLVAEGQSPRAPLSFMAPTGGFRVVKRAGRTVMAPEGQARYDGVVRALASVDVKGVQRVYQELEPLLDAAHAEMAPPGRSLKQALAQAIGRLTRVEVPRGPVELTPKGALYVYADPRLEALGGAEKHLLRMGPENMRKVQAKLSELAGALGLPSPEQAGQP